MAKRVLLSLAVATAAASIAVWAAYSRDMRLAHERLRGKSKVVSTPFGDLEYAEGGVGLPVLVIHGSGGGFDQGELLARAVLGEGTRWVAPSHDCKRQRGTDLN